VSERLADSLRCVAWTGHRVIPNPELVAGSADRVLAEVVRQSRQDAGNGARDCALSGFGSAAMGADLIVAGACIRLGVPIRLVLPCSTKHMLASMPWSLRSTFTRVCDASLEVLTADCEAASEEDHIKVAQQISTKADVLIAVWDGLPARGPGGTGDVVRMCSGRCIPIVRIDPQSAAIDWSCFG